MTSLLKIEKIEESKLREVWSVEDFVRRHRICKEEEARLKKLFGDFATKQELLSNAQRPPQFR
ncbi:MULTISPECIES: hypothetical protein [Rhizobium]|uniref:Uncharacterized protein n=1 Tax=Rhizobium tropici TaxID=398 RepID=A0A6P1C9S0_RHITR|nr:MULTISPECIES: hypothetical protein [Rhizobium]AGB69579.1 hypothetical protein RTCIAT899_CH00765 [Rhizobium tropici CIAT 899]MBB4244390.1 hypothetical protein [Rhizobium tropici]MBB5595666.1 hypothetical protein [Rhizobium tropici]MBB6494729.1 hypothetical protein [Rhizobium tropici]NEV13201.1 hypothetical protein [Rhizobium tropici]